MTMKPITDRAELALDFPEKTYMGSFGRSSSFEARTDEDGVALKLERHQAGRRVVELHLHWHLFADVLRDLASGMAHHRPLQPYELTLVREAAQALVASLAEKEQP